MAGFQSLDELEAVITDKLKWVNPKARHIIVCLNSTDYDHSELWHAEFIRKAGRLIRPIGEMNPKTPRTLAIQTSRGALTLRGLDGIEPRTVILVCGCCDQVIMPYYDPDN